MCRQAPRIRNPTYFSGTAFSGEVVESPVLVPVLTVDGPPWSEERFTLIPTLPFSAV